MRRLTRHGEASRVAPAAYELSSSPAVMLAAAGEQEAAHRTVSAVLDISPPEYGSVGGLEHLSDRIARHGLGC